jgi:glycosyltransferase involved in cell wall biosynthesis
MLTLRPGRMGGSETYARGLARALAEHGSLEYRCLVRTGAEDAAAGLPAEVGRRLDGLDAVHYPFTIPVPRTRLPTVVTLHDLLHREGSYLPSPSKRLLRRYLYDRAARRGALVIVPSLYVRDRAHELLGLPLERVRAVYHGIDHDRFHPRPEGREGFLLYPAQPWAHKNHARLFEAFALLRSERPELELVLTGDRFRDLPAGVRTAGRVGWDELPSLYRRAGALVFPSLHEGFGYPPLEAMASGCPVACSNATALPEICGDAAIFFDPTSVHEMATAAARALEAGEELIRRGLERAARFTWVEAARGHEAVYRELSD